MSSFDLAIPVLLKIEGGFVENPNDPGGATNFGISARTINILSLASRAYLGIYHDNLVTIEEVKNITEPQAINYYQNVWWNIFNYSEITNQDVATKAFCSAVNMGNTHAMICLQRAVRATSGKELEQDGLLGAETLQYVNEYASTTLLASYRSELAGYYRLLDNPAEIHGWLNRAYS